MHAYLSNSVPARWWFSCVLCLSRLVQALALVRVLVLVPEQVRALEPERVRALVQEPVQVRAQEPGRVRALVQEPVRAQEPERVLAPEQVRAREPGRDRRSWCSQDWRRQ